MEIPIAGPQPEPAPSHPDDDRAAPIRIEPVTWGDLRELVAIQKQSFPARLAYGWSALLTLRVWPGVVFLVAKERDSGAVAGCCIGDRSRGSARVMNLAIHPEWRRRGIGRALLRALGEAIPEGDVTLMVQEHNTGAQALYTSEGFIRSGTVLNYYGKGQHGISMRKPRYASVAPRTIVT
ncbi:MAG: GNAT family N-acetyltransferase [Thermomicrobiales bacterium]